MLGGKDEDVQRATPIVSQFSRKVEHIGPLGSGHGVKSINNLLNSAHLLAITEGLLALKETAGIPAADAVRCINVSSGRSLQSMVRIPEEVLSGKYHYGFDINLMKKDSGLARNILEDYMGDGGAGGGADPSEPKLLNSRTGSALLTATENVDMAAAYYSDKPKPPGADVTDYTYLSRYLEEQLGREEGKFLRDEPTACATS